MQQFAWGHIGRVKTESDSLRILGVVEPNPSLGAGWVGGWKAAREQEFGGQLHFTDPQDPRAGLTLTPPQVTSLLFPKGNWLGLHTLPFCFFHCPARATMPKLRQRSCNHGYSLWCHRGSVLRGVGGLVKHPLSPENFRAQMSPILFTLLPVGCRTRNLAVFGQWPTIQDPSHNFSTGWCKSSYQKVG